MRNNFAAVLWDFDGVIINSEKIWLEKAPEFHQSLILNSSKIDVKQMTGGGPLTAWKFLYQNFGLKLSFADFRAKLIQFGEQEVYPNATLNPNVKETIKNFIIKELNKP